MQPLLFVIFDVFFCLFILVVRFVVRLSTRLVRGLKHISYSPPVFLDVLDGGGLRC